MCDVLLILRSIKNRYTFWSQLNISLIFWFYKPEEMKWLFFTNFSYFRKNVSSFRLLAQLNSKSFKTRNIMKGFIENTCFGNKNYIQSKSSACPNILETFWFLWIRLLSSSSGIYENIQIWNRIRLTQTYFATYTVVYTGFCVWGGEVPVAWGYFFHWRNQKFHIFSNSKMFKKC